MTLLDWTRRGMIAAAGAAFALAPLGTAAQTPEGVLIVGQVAEPKSLDPAAVTAVNDFRILVNLYEGLTKYESGTLEVAPGLAESWEISEDGTEYTLSLREGVTFHDGTPFNAEAVKFNFDRMLNEDHPYHDTGPFPLAFFFSSVEETEVVDDLTVKFNLSEPYAPFLSNLAYPTGLLVSPAAVEAGGADFGRSPVGTGPFKFVEWRPNEAVVIDRYEDYWGDPAGAQAVVFRPIEDSNTRVAEMLAGGIDMMVEVPPTSLGQFEGDEFTVVEQAGPHVWFLILNAKEGPLADKAVRQAVNYAINKEAIVNDVSRAPPRSPPARRRRPSPGPTTRSSSPTPTTRRKPRSCWPRPGPRAPRSPSTSPRAARACSIRSPWAPRSRPTSPPWASTFRSRPTSGTPSSAT